MGPAAPPPQLHRKAPALLSRDIRDCSHTPGEEWGAVLCDLQPGCPQCHQKALQEPLHPHTNLAAQEVTLHMGELQPEPHRGVLEQQKGQKSDSGSQIQFVNRPKKNLSGCAKEFYKK